LAGGGGGGCCPKSNHESHHPVTRELVLSLLQAYICKSNDHVKGNNAPGSATAFISQCTKILFDDRTTPPLRRNTAALLIRLQVSSHGTVAEVSRQLVEYAMEAWIRQQPVPKSSRKRKRNRASTTTTITKATDLVDIWEALVGQGFSKSRVMGEAPMIPKTLRGWYTQSLSETEQIMVSAPARYIVSMAFLQRFFLSGTVYGIEECNKIFRMQVGVDASHVANALLNTTSTIQFCSNTDDVSKTILHEKAMLLLAAMRLSASINESFGGCDSSLAPVDTSLSLVTTTISKRFLVKQHENLAAKYRALFWFAALQVLQSLGRAIRSEGDEQQVLEVRPGPSFTLSRCSTSCRKKSYCSRFSLFRFYCRE
jgi:hypothetical protein